jgi:hypothetical protein
MNTDLKDNLPAKPEADDGGFEGTESNSDRFSTRLKYDPAPAIGARRTAQIFRANHS